MPGYSLTEHKERAGQAFQDSKLRVLYSKTLFPNRVVYSMELDKMSLVVVRSDEGVEFMESVGYVTFDTDIEADNPGRGRDQATEINSGHYSKIC